MLSWIGHLGERLGMRCVGGDAVGVGVGGIMHRCKSTAERSVGARLGF